MQEDLFDAIDTEHLGEKDQQGFIGIRLRMKIGHFDPGDEFETAIMDYDLGRITLARDGREWTYELKLTTGHRVEL